jgi:hypothetical protein
VRREAANRVTINCWYQRRCVEAGDAGRTTTSAAASFPPPLFLPLSPAAAASVTSRRARSAPACTAAALPTAPFACNTKKQKKQGVQFS